MTALLLKEVLTLRTCLKMTQFHCTSEAEYAFQEIKSRLNKLPTMTTPLTKEPLTLYMAVSDREVGVVLMADRNIVQTPIYFVSRTLTDKETRYSTLEKLILTLK